MSTKVTPPMIALNKNFDFTAELKKNGVDVATVDDVLSAFAITTTDLINSSSSPSVGDAIATSGYYSSGDEGGGLWVFKGTAGQTPSQSPVDLGLAKLTDATGNEWNLLPIIGLAKRSFSSMSVGARFDGSDDTMAIQAALNAASSSGGGEVTLGNGTATLTAQGQTGVTDYCLLVGSNTEIAGAGIGLTILKLADNQDATLIATDQNVITSNIIFRDFEIDGNQENQPDINTSFGFWVRGAQNVLFENTKSSNCADFGFRIQTVDGLRLGDIVSDQGDAVTSDGFHLIDCVNVTGSRVRVTTRGDDGFVIEANGADTHDISIASVVIDTPVTGSGAGKGLYLVNASANSDIGVQRMIYNINMPNVVTYNCAATALMLERGQFSNININLVDVGSFRSFGVILGDTTGVGVTGSVSGCNIKVISKDSTEHSVLFIEEDGTCSDCSFDINSNNSGDGFPAIHMIASSSIINAIVNYNPNSDKVSQSQCVRLIGSNNALTSILDGGNSNIRIEGSDNTLTPVKSTNPTIRDIEITAGSDNNIICNGHLSTGVLDSGVGNEFYSTKGATTKGQLSDTTNGSGNIVIPHGLVKAPVTVTSNILGDNPYDCEVQAINATNITLRVRDTTDNSDVTSVAVTVMYEASI